LSLRTEAAIRALTARTERLAERLTGAEAADRKSLALACLPVESLSLESWSLESRPLKSLSLESLPLGSLPLKCLHGQMLCELLNSNTNLLGDSTLHGNLLRELAQHRDDLVCRYVDPCVTGKRAREERIRREGLVAELAHSELRIAELRVAVVPAGLSKRSGAHLPKPGLHSWKLGRQALRRIL
jgi:hypothetical protein